MKRNLLLSLAVLSLSLGSCSLFDFGSKHDNEKSLLSGSGLYLVNEGNFNGGNGSLSFFSFDSMKIHNDLFSSVNSRPLGDVPFSIEIYEGKAYIVVNNSGKIEVMDMNTLKSTATIPDLDSPRNILFVNSGKAYVTSLWSKEIAVFDPVTSKVRNKINLRRSSEGIVRIGDLAYVTCWVSGSEVMVIDTKTDQVVDSVSVGHEPESIVTDKNGRLWILCSGGYSGDYFPQLICLNTNDFSSYRTFTFPTKTEYPSTLRINTTGDTLYYIDNDLYRLSINADRLPTQPLLKASGRSLYKLAIRNINGEVFVTNAMDYQQKGYLLRILKDGTVADSVRTDIIPGSMYLRKN